MMGIYMFLTVVLVAVVCMWIGWPGTVCVDPYHKHLGKRHNHKKVTR
jgi:hypothetical protein